MMHCESTSLELNSGSELGEEFDDLGRPLHRAPRLEFPSGRRQVFLKSRANSDGAQQRLPAGRPERKYQAPAREGPYGSPLALSLSFLPLFAHKMASLLKNTARTTFRSARVARPVAPAFLQQRNYTGYSADLAGLSEEQAEVRFELTGSFDTKLTLLCFSCARL